MADFGSHLHHVEERVAGMERAFQTMQQQLQQMGQQIGTELGNLKAQVNAGNTPFMQGMRSAMGTVPVYNAALSGGQAGHPAQPPAPQESGPQTAGISGRMATHLKMCQKPDGSKVDISSMKEMSTAELLQLDEAKPLRALLEFSSALPHLFHPFVDSKGEIYYFVDGLQVNDAVQALSVGRKSAELPLSHLVRIYRRRIPYLTCDMDKNGMRYRAMDPVAMRTMLLSSSRAHECKISWNKHIETFCKFYNNGGKIQDWSIKIDVQPKGKRRRGKHRHLVLSRLVERYERWLIWDAKQMEEMMAYIRSDAYEPLFPDFDKENVFVDNSLNCFVPSETKHVKVTKSTALEALIRQHWEIKADEHPEIRVLMADDHRDDGENYTAVDPQTSVKRGYFKILLQDTLHRKDGKLELGNRYVRKDNPFKGYTFFVDPIEKADYDETVKTTLVKAAPSHAPVTYSFGLGVLPYPGNSVVQVKAPSDDPATENWVIVGFSKKGLTPLAWPGWYSKKVGWKKEPSREDMLEFIRTTSLIHYKEREELPEWRHWKHLFNDDEETPSLMEELKTELESPDYQSHLVTAHKKLMKMIEDKSVNGSVEEALADSLLAMKEERGMANKLFWTPGAGTRHPKRKLVAEAEKEVK
jgi:hypothetical protein